MAAFTGSSKLRSIKGEKSCGVKFVFQLSREALVNQCTQHYFCRKELSPQYSWGQTTKLEECPEPK